MADRIARPSVRRWVSGVALTLQLAAAPAAAMADTRLDARGPGVAHVESEGAERCPSPHAHLACQLCRAVTFGAAPPASRHAIAVSHTADVLAHGAMHLLAATAARRATPEARAPPSPTL